MDDYSKGTLRRIEQNNLIELGICNKATILSRNGGRLFTSRDGDDYSRLGSFIGTNTTLEKLVFETEGIRLSTADSGFFKGIKQNSSIQELKINGYPRNPIGEVVCELLQAFHENNSHLISLHISCCDISKVDERGIINTTLNSCRYLKKLCFNHSNMTDEHLFPMVEAIRGHPSLEELHLWHNHINNAGCEALATLLRDPNCNLHTLDLNTNQISILGANTLANSLTNNTELEEFDLGENSFWSNYQSVEDAFARLLCNTTTLNSIHSSNHTLDELTLSNSTIGIGLGDIVVTLLQINEGTNKSHVAIEKILKYHPKFEMEPLFEWGSRDERNLLALPYIVDWFDRAKEAIEHENSYYSSDDSSSGSFPHCNHYQIEEKKLTAIYEFAQAMPLMFNPASHMPLLFIPTSDKRRKRN